MELSGFTRSNVNRSDDSRPIDEKDSWVGGDPKILRGLFVQIVTDRDSDRVFGKKTRFLDATCVRLNVRLISYSHNGATETAEQITDHLDHASVIWLAIVIAQLYRHNALLCTSVSLL